MPYDMLFYPWIMLAHIQHFGLMCPVIAEPSPVKSTAHDRFSHIVARLGDGA